MPSLAPISPRARPVTSLPRSLDATLHRATTIDEFQGTSAVPMTEASNTLDAAALQQSLDQSVKDLHAEAGIVAVRGPTGEWVGASGRTSDGRQVLPTDRFRIGSITKTFTAALVLQLVQEGRLSLNQTLDHWDQFRDFPNASRITVEELLNHAAGTADYTTAPEFAGQATWDREGLYSLAKKVGGFTRAEWVALLKTAYPDATSEEIDKGIHALEAFEPGTRYRYSNSNYLLLGLIIEAVTGLTYPEALQQRLFGPLGLTSTSVILTDDKAPGQVPPAPVNAEGHPSYIAHASGAWSAGAIVSSAKDLVTWMDDLLSGKVIRPDLLKRMTTPSGAAEGGSEYGLGLVVSSDERGQFIGHDGFIPPHGAIVKHYIDSGETWVAFSNTDSEEKVVFDDLLSAVQATTTIQRPSVRAPLAA